MSDRRKAGVIRRAFNLIATIVLVAFLIVAIMFLVLLAAGARLRM